MVKVGDIVVSIKNNSIFKLNEKYTVIGVEYCHNNKYTPNDYILITIDKTNKRMSYNYDVYFKLLTEIRKEKINRLKEKINASR